MQNAGWIMRLVRKIQMFIFQTLLTLNEKVNTFISYVSTLYKRLFSYIRCSVIHSLNTETL